MKSTKNKKTVSGIIEITRRGVGYLPFEGKEDIEIQTAHLMGALNGDVVEVEVSILLPRPKGVVTRIVSRAKEEFVCTIKNGAAVPDDVRVYRPIRLKEKLSVAEGEKVLVRLIEWSGRDFVGMVLQHIGRAGEHKTEMNAIVLEHGFRTEFPPEVAAEARALEHGYAETIEKESSHRADFRSVPTVTIDPPDAKDFDDALSLVELPDGTVEVGIHIADVGALVEEGSTIDREAQKRGTSVYLVDSTIPMLPQELSGNICSLREGEDRLTFSVVVRMTREGRVLKREFQKSIIHSNKRFTYEEAQAVLNSGKGLFSKELGILRHLARTLKKGREKEGAIDFGDSEVTFTLDQKGKPLSVTRKERLETNSLIEEFMLLANREVAQYISELAKKIPEKGLVFLYRIHDTPKEDRIEELATFVRAIGYEFGKGKKFSARDIKNLLKQIEGKPEEHLIRTATLRSMAKAIYSTKNIGHFGLAFEHYTHFTSPIRRYPDMLVHRILASHLDGNPMTRKEFGHLEKLCIAASEQEAKAVDAERDSIRYKQVEYMSSKIGQAFEAVISGVTDWGLYVEESESAAEGLVRIRTLGDDFYNYVPKSYSLVGQKTKKKFSLGDRVRVKLVAADLAARQLDFELVR